MRILITGASGFIGKTLTEGLSKENYILHPTHEELDLLNSSNVESYLKNKKNDALIHCAVKGGPNLLPETILMFANLVKHSNKFKRIIYMGTGAEYGKQRDLKKVSEKEIGKIIPEDNFGVSRLICNNLAKRYKNVINLRIFGAYGKNENYLQAFISNAIAKNLLGLPIVINQNVKFDYLFAEELIPVVNYFLKYKAKYSDYNVTPTKSITLKEIAEIINKISNKSSKIKILHKGMNFTYTGNNRRLLSEVKNLKFTSYEDGIRELYNYNKKHVEKLDKKAIIQDHYLARLKINETSKKLSK